MSRYCWAIIPVAWVATSLFAIGDEGSKKTREATATKKERVRNMRVKALFEDMRDGKYGDRRFPALDWTDIPALLELADSTTSLKAFPRNSISSQRQAECSEGMVALWLIEGIRQGGKFPSLNALCFKKGRQAKNWCKASEENHKEVAKAYRTWGRKVESLDRQNAGGIDPLKGTNLYWY